MKLPAKYKGATPGPWSANEGQNGCWFIWDAKGGIQTENLIATFNGRVNADYRDPVRAKADALLVSDAPMLACRVAELEDENEKLRRAGGALWEIVVQHGQWSEDDFELAASNNWITTLAGGQALAGQPDQASADKSAAHD